MNSVSLGTRLGVKRASRVAAWLLIGAGACGCSSLVSLGDLYPLGSSVGGDSALPGPGGNDGRSGGDNDGRSSGGDNDGRSSGGNDGRSSGDSGGSLASSAGGAGGDLAAPCPMQACVSSAPAGWLGPFASWEGQTDAPETLPDCPPGYEDPMDLHRELNAPPSACTCTCAAQGQVCNENATLQIFIDASCSASCATASLQACDAVSGCYGSQGSLRAEPPKLSGGFCQATVSAPAAPTWQYDARLCRPSNLGNCEDPGQSCAPPPASPFLTALCVMRVIVEGQALPTCPAEYPNPREALYASFSDSRGCSDCSCSGVTGGSCSGTVMLSGGSDCESGISYALGSGCKTFNLGSGIIQPSHAGAQYSVSPGACGVASAAYPTGSAAPSGAIRAVCCQ